jgi:flagellar hook assembly protein FlgD
LTQPLNPFTNIGYFSPTDARLKLTVYNLKAEKVRKLIDTFQIKGAKKVIWDGKDSEGKKVSGGLYLCKLDTDAHCEIIRMVVLK